MDYNPPDSPVHGTLQGRILEWVAMPSSRGPQYCYLNFRLDRDFTNCPSNVLYCERKHIAFLYHISNLVSLKVDQFLSLPLCFHAVDNFEE